LWESESDVTEANGARGSFRMSSRHGRFNVLERRVTRFLREPPTVRAFIAILTAVITSTFIARATRESDAARMKDELTDRVLMERRFDEFERKLDDFAATR
jgi:hypothetical protein